jgi:hypothetical protein
MIDYLSQLHHRVPKTLVSDLASRRVSSKATLLAYTVVHKLLPI